MNNPKVLIACEESQRVCCAFRARGIEAYSCDIQEPSGGHPEWHILGDVIPVLYGGAVTTMDGARHDVSQWDLVIAHPPCTDLASSGAGSFAKKRADGSQQRSIDFFMQFANYSGRYCIENPVGIMSTIFRKPDQIIQPWQFAETPDEAVQKTTCLWLNGVPLLSPLITKKPDIKYHKFVTKDGKIKCQSEWYYSTRLQGAKKRAKVASKTFYGIAHAFAKQYGDYLLALEE